jgi:hypothetical protein
MNLYIRAINRIIVPGGLDYIDVKVGDGVIRVKSKKYV